MGFESDLRDFCIRSEKFKEMNLGLKMSMFLAAYFSIAESNSVPYEVVELIISGALKEYHGAPKEDYGNN